MRMFGRGLILAALLCASVPSRASATPVLMGNPLPTTDCTGVVGSTTATGACRVFSLGSLLGTTTLDVTFGSDKDVALFGFSIDADSDFLALTSSLGASLDTMLGLFIHDPGGESDGLLYSYGEGPIQAFGGDIDPFGNFNDQLGEFVLSAGTSYYLAVLLNPLNSDDGINGFSGSPSSLRQPFSCDGEGLCPGGGGSFSLTLSAISEEQPAAVPEPGTLTLLGTGAVAALVRRRAKKRAEA